MAIEGFWATDTPGSAANLNATLLQVGLAVARPASSAATLGMSYYATDTGVMSRDNGTTWDETQPLADQAAGTASLRTLGTAADQAAAGDHSHVAVQDVAPSEVAHNPNGLALDPGIARDTGIMNAPVDITTMTDSISPSVPARIWSAAAHYSECTLDTAPTSGSTYWQLIIDGTVVESISRANGPIGVGLIYEDTLSGEKDVLSGARTITTHIDRNSEGNNSLGFKYMGMLTSGAMRGQ